ncbi:hypothetical protein JAAARDRAFT_197466, partial [Jaapia argillacea MUCL 33604]
AGCASGCARTFVKIKTKVSLPSSAADFADWLGHPHDEAYQPYYPQDSGDPYTRNPDNDYITYNLGTHLGDFQEEEFQYYHYQPDFCNSLRLLLGDPLLPEEPKISDIFAVEQIDFFASSIVSHHNMSDPSKIPASVIPIFDGSNYKQWSTIITGICRHNNSWSVVKPGGNHTCPAAAEEKAVWEEKNDKALGLFTVYMHPTLHRFLTKEDGSDRAAGEVWDELKKSYGEANAITGFVDFQTLTRTVFTTETPLCSQITSMEASRARCI